MSGQMELQVKIYLILSAGTYSVVATDENGCSVSIEVEITESDAMDISELMEITQDLVFHVMEQQMVLLM